MLICFGFTFACILINVSTWQPRECLTLPSVLESRDSKITNLGYQLLNRSGKLHSTDLLSICYFFLGPGPRKPTPHDIREAIVLNRFWDDEFLGHRFFFICVRELKEIWPKKTYLRKWIRRFIIATKRKVDILACLAY